MENLYHLMEGLFMKDSGEMINLMGRELKGLQMVLHLQANSLMESKKEIIVFINGLMERSTQAHSEMV